ncbi:glycosyl transferase [Novosphingobium flavum]|uniref:Glycosyl transferase n=1 Tax=Novosphingobium flavum TaxID=1778672 RepID=A0A7X1KM61_9SPHN|nr:beta-1,6-N-acetylglucosaminyltransferase [Novosphingobium flavum]MBC2666043.1 glycosyl transferase [Novosphingobium flavum]
MSQPARFAWLVLAHADAAQLRALVDRLAPPGGPDFAVVHLDAKSPLWRETRGAFLTPRPELAVIPRPVAVRWGHNSQVAATRLLLAEALRRPFTMAHLVSGADWPLAAPEAMIPAPAQDCCIEAAPALQAERMERLRLDARCLRPDPAKPWLYYPARALRALSRLLPPRRVRPWGEWHKGSQWWSLPRDVCAAILPELDRAFAQGRLAGTVCADEHLIQTIVAQRFAQRIAPGNRRFIRWDGQSSPQVLTAADWPEAEASGAWLARKVSREHDPFFLAQ